MSTELETHPQDNPQTNLISTTSLRDLVKRISEQTSLTPAEVVKIIHSMKGGQSHG